MNRVNRLVLGVLGIVLILLAVLTALIDSGLLGRLLAGTGRVQPDAHRPVLPPEIALNLPAGLPAALIVGGLVLALAALGWLLANIPRDRPPTPFRLHDDPAEGTTVIEPAALNRAVTRQIEDLPGALAASAAVRGASAAPHLAVRVTIDDRADIARVLGAIGDEVAAGLQTALGSRVERLGILVDIDRRSDSAAVAVVAPPPVATG